MFVVIPWIWYFKMLAWVEDTTKRAMQRVKIYNDLLHLTGEWMNADMLNRGGERPLHLPLDPPLILIQISKNKSLPTPILKPDFQQQQKKAGGMVFFGGKWKMQILQLQIKIFLLLIHVPYYNVCRPHKYSSPQIFWTGKNQDIATFCNFVSNFHNTVYTQFLLVNINIENVRCDLRL